MAKQNPPAAKAASRPNDRIGDDDLLAAFKASLESARRTGTDVVVRRSSNDYEILRWIDGAWECLSVARPGPGGSSHILGYGA